MATRTRIVITILVIVAAIGVIVPMATDAYREAVRPPVVITIPAQVASSSPLPYAPQLSAAQTSSSTVAPPAASSSGPLYVHVAGAVTHPGVYQLATGCRIFDALHAAGGTLRVADSNAVDLAEPIRDGEKVYIPIRGEKIATSVDATDSGNKINGAVSAPATIQTNAAKHSRNESGAHTDKLTSPAQGTIDINSAGASDLQRVPGIGPAMAQRIIDERSRIGHFRKPNDLLNVTGIGPKKYAKMAPFVKV